jgi:hypothetical protein
MQYTHPFDVLLRILVHVLRKWCTKQRVVDLMTIEPRRARLGHRFAIICVLRCRLREDGGLPSSSPIPIRQTEGLGCGGVLVLVRIVISNAADEVIDMIVKNCLSLVTHVLSLEEGWTYLEEGEVRSVPRQEDDRAVGTEAIHDLVTILVRNVLVPGLFRPRCVW